MNKKSIIAHACFSALCAYALHRSTTIICKRVGLRDSLTTRVHTSHLFFKCIALPLH